MIGLHLKEDKVIERHGDKKGPSKDELGGSRILLAKTMLQKRREARENELKLANEMETCMIWTGYRTF